MVVVASASASTLLPAGLVSSDHIASCRSWSFGLYTSDSMSESDTAVVVGLRDFTGLRPRAPL